MEIRMAPEAKTAADGITLAVALATFLSWLPNITALFSLIWVLMRTFEGIPKFLDTCSDLKGRWKKWIQKRSD